VDTNDEEENRALRIRKSRLGAKIDQGNILLHRALKVARGFERQKLGRRLKAAKENPRELLRLNEEVIVLKQLDLAKRAENYLLKQLVRTKRIRVAPAFVSLHSEVAETKVEGVKGGAEANVVGRLMNSNPVKEVVPGIMSGLYGVLGLEERSSNTDAERETEKPSDIQRSELSSVRNDVDRSVDDSSWEGFSHIEEDYRSDVSADLSVHKSLAQSDRLITAVSASEDLDTDEDIAQYGHRIASSSPSKDGSDAEENDTFGGSPLHTNGRPQVTEAFSLSPSPSPSLVPSKTTPNPSITKPPPVHTTFLPSLTLGGYFSGSESNSDSDLDQRNPYQHHLSSKGAPGPALPEPRKNRRGQRARQQIAEKKFGSSAKHLQKQQLQQRLQTKEGRSGDRDGGWDVRKGATAETGENSRGRQAGRGRGGKDRGMGFGKVRSTGPTGANGEAVAARSTRREDPKTGGGDADGGPIHPSWEAAKKRKAQRAKVTGLFQGKKITF